MKKKFTGKGKHKLKVVNQPPTKLTLRLKDKSRKKSPISKIIECYIKKYIKKYNPTHKKVQPHPSQIICLIGLILKIE